MLINTIKVAAQQEAVPSKNNTTTPNSYCIKECPQECCKPQVLKDKVRMRLQKVMPHSQKTSMGHHNCNCLLRAVWTQELYLA